MMTTLPRWMVRRYHTKMMLKEIGLILRLVGECFLICAIGAIAIGIFGFLVLSCLFTTFYWLDWFFSMGCISTSIVDGVATCTMYRYEKLDMTIWGSGAAAAGIAIVIVYVVSRYFYIKKSAST